MFVPKNLVDQVKEIIFESDPKNNREISKDDEDVTVEYAEDSQRDDSNDTQQPVNRHHLQGAPKVALFKVLDSSTIAPLATTTVQMVDDIVKLVKQRVLQELIAKNPIAQASKNVLNKYLKPAEGEGQMENLIYKPVPVKVLKEEVLFEATYEDTLDENVETKSHYQGMVVQEPKRKPILDKSHTKYILSKNNRFVNPQDEGDVKKVRYVKQVVVPVDSNQGQPVYVSQPSLGQHVSIVQQPNLEPQLSLMQQPSVVQKPSIVQQLALMQQQIDRLNKIIEQKVLKKIRIVQSTPQTVLEAPQLNIEAVEAHFEIIPNPKADEQKTKEAEESELSAETTVVTETSTKALTVPSIVKNKKNTEDNEVTKDTAGTVENDNEAVQEDAEKTENKSNDEEGTTPEPNATTLAESGEGTVKNNARLGTNSKIYTKEFGTPDVGMPIVQKTYNFNAPMAVDKEPVSLNWPADSARKVMLF